MNNSSSRSQRVFADEDFSSDQPALHVILTQASNPTEDALKEEQIFYYNDQESTHGTALNRNSTSQGYAQRSSVIENDLPADPLVYKTYITQEDEGELSGQSIEGYQPALLAIEEKNADSEQSHRPIEAKYHPILQICRKTKQIVSDFLLENDAPQYQRTYPQSVGHRTKRLKTYPVPEADSVPFFSKEEAIAANHMFQAMQLNCYRGNQVASSVPNSKKRKLWEITKDDYDTDQPYSVGFNLIAPPSSQFKDKGQTSLSSEHQDISSIPQFQEIHSHPSQEESKHPLPIDASEGTVRQAVNPRPSAEGQLVAKSTRASPRESIKPQQITSEENDPEMEYWHYPDGTVKVYSKKFIAVLNEHIDEFVTDHWQEFADHFEDEENIAIINRYIENLKIVTRANCFKDKLSFSLLEQDYLLAILIKKSNKIFGQKLKNIIVLPQDMKRIYTYRKALAIVYSQKELITARSYYWLRELLMGNIKLPWYEIYHFFFTVLIETLIICPRVYRFILEHFFHGQLLERYHTQLCLPKDNTDRPRLEKRLVSVQGDNERWSNYFMYLKGINKLEEYDFFGKKGICNIMDDPALSDIFLMPQEYTIRDELKIKLNGLKGKVGKYYTFFLEDDEERKARTDEIQRLERLNEAQKQRQISNQMTSLRKGPVDLAREQPALGRAALPAHVNNVSQIQSSSLRLNSQRLGQPPNQPLTSQPSPQLMAQLPGSSALQRVTQTPATRFCVPTPSNGIIISKQGKAAPSHQKNAQRK
ncbi:hypothetical protein FGO68_gene12662 [Halteria grandinella]|uniref:Uncharacterized protein n=1 Tax=Halteria grandinella TaxID=5974 RepID=A0A8J8P0I7_HALGN|nr:hypothetical protein FGO68_gene12662 [Halteria grandinella]